MSVAVSKNKKLILASTGVLAFGLAAYGLGRVYPPLGPSQGTVAPADRYVSCAGRRRRRHPWRHRGCGIDADRRVRADGQRSQFPRARREPGLPGARRPAAGDGGADGQSRRRSARSPSNPRLRSTSPRRHRQSGERRGAASAASNAPVLMNAMAGHSAALQALAKYPRCARGSRAQRSGLRQFRGQRQRVPRTPRPSRLGCACWRAMPRRSSAGANDNAAMHALRRDPQVFSALAANAAAFKALVRPAAGARRGRQQCRRRRSPAALSRHLAMALWPPCRGHANALAALAGAAASALRRSPAIRRRSRRSPRIRRRCRRSWPMAGSSAASPTTPMRSARPPPMPPPMRASQAMPPPSSGWPTTTRRCRRSAAIRECSRRSATMPLAFAALASNARQLSPQLIAPIGNNAAAFGRLAPNPAQLDAAPRAMQAFNAHALLAASAASAACRSTQRVGIAGGACQPAGVLGDDGQSQGVRGDLPPGRRHWLRCRRTRGRWRRSPGSRTLRRSWPTRASRRL